jgi:hypothetical protein
MVNKRSKEPLICALLLAVSILASPSFAAGKRWSSKGQPGPRKYGTFGAEFAPQ